MYTGNANYRMFTDAVQERTRSKRMNLSDDKKITIQGRSLRDTHLMHVTSEDKRPFES